MNGILSAFLMVITFTLSFILIRKIELTYTTVYINLIRAIIGFSCFIIYNVITGRFHQIFNLNLRIWGILGASIIFSVVIGDTAYFKCQKLIGPTNAATFAITSPIFTMVLAILFLGNSFQWILLLSTIITGTGVYLLVHLQEKPATDQHLEVGLLKKKEDLNKKTLLLGSLFGILASLSWSFANIFTEMGMEQSEEILQIGSDITMVTNIIRYFIASTCMGGWMINRSKKEQKTQSNQNPGSTRRSILILLLSAILGPFLGEIFFGISIVQLGSTFIAIMGSTLPVFTIPFNYIINKEKVDLKSLPGILVTIVGVIVLIIAST